MHSIGNSRFKHFPRTKFTSLQSSLAAGTASPSLIGSYDSSFSLDYPGLFQPFKTKAMLVLSCAVAITYAYAQVNPATFSNIRQLILRTLPFLSKIKLSVRQFVITLLIALVFNQEIQLQRRFIVDFRPLTGGHWSEVDNVVVHYLRNASASILALNLYLFHGFGANSLSWQPVMKLFKRNAVNAVAHDLAGFGFNPRIRKVPTTDSFPTIYQPLWNAKASLTFSGASGSSKDKNGVFLMGHSLGAVSSMAAAAAVLSDDIRSREGAVSKRDVTLVLVDPAFTFSPDQLGKSLDKTADDIKETSSSVLEKVATAVKNSQPKSSITNVNVLIDFFEFTVKFVKSILMWPMKIALRRLTHLDYFWYKSLAGTWGNTNKIQAQDVWRYKLASMAKGFDDDLFRFMYAQRPSSKDAQSSTDGGVGGPFSSSSIVTGVTQVDLLASLVDLGCRVVIVHGTADRIVPYSSSERMTALVQEELSVSGSKKGLELYPLQEFGHVPQEEDPALFLQKLSEIGIKFPLK
jgi:pimeloyl-ACP methyl ester carboxylesterase